MISFRLVTKKNTEIISSDILAEKKNSSISTQILVGIFIHSISIFCWLKNGRLFR